MKIMWVMARPVSGTCGTSNKSTSGSWLDAAYESCKDADDVELHIVSLGKVDHLKEFSEGKHHFYLLPIGNPTKYDINSSSNIQEWNKLKELVTPDVLQIWGTEKSVYLLAQRTFSSVPSVVYIQGVVAKVAEDYCGNMSWRDKWCNISLQDIYRHTWIDATQRGFEKMAEIEAEILRNADGVIVENDWCASQIMAINPNCKIFHSKLPIKNDFFKEDWDVNNIEDFSILTNAGAAPLKGHHVLFKALSYVVKEYPQTQVYIPGFSRMTNSWKDKLGRNGYSNYLRKLIKKYNLEGHINYIGVLTSEELAKKISLVNAFVMPSSVENHSSSLIEAMIVGAPCVSSYVGGVSSVACHGKNALLYNFSDAQFLAGCICKIFGSKETALSMSNEAKKIRDSRHVDILCDFITCYQALLTKDETV